MIAYNLPALAVIIPLLTAPVVALLPNRHQLPWLGTLLTVLATFAVSVALLYLAMTQGAMSYAMGGWVPPYGIEVRIDAVNALVLMLVNAIALVSLLYGLGSNQQEIPLAQQSLFYTAFLLCLMGLAGIALTGDLFNLFVFVEISSLGTYALIACGRDRRALTSAFQYLIMGTIGATFILIAVGLLYSITGTLNMLDLAERLPEANAPRTTVTAMAFMVVGLALKVAIFPLHLWLPGAYTMAPNFVTIFLAATATKVALYALIRVIYTVFGVEFAFSAAPLGLMLLVLSIVAAFSGSIVAVYQNNLKRLLAYSSVAQVGYMTLGVSLATTLGLAAGLLHLFNHALMKAALFMAVGCIFYATGSVKLDALRGIGKTMPWTVTAFVLAGLSLVGVPLTAGFVSKWYLVQALLEADFALVALLVMISSLIAVIYLWKVVEAAWFHEPSAAAANPRPVPRLMLATLWLMVAANFYFGIHTVVSVDVALYAAELLKGGQ